MSDANQKHLDEWPDSMNVKQVEDTLTRRGFLVDIEYVKPFMLYEFRIRKARRPCWEMSTCIAEQQFADVVHPGLVDYLEYEFNRQTSGDISNA